MKGTVSTRLANFFYGLHALIHFAETSEHALMAVEKDLLPDNPQIDEARERVSKNESATIRLIRTASKAFTNMYSLPWKPFCGSRFNVLFDNAAGTFFLHTRMLNYLREMGANNLLTQFCVICRKQRCKLGAKHWD